MTQIIYLKKKLQGRNILTEIDIDNNIEYDVKPYEVKNNIVKCTKDNRKY